MKSNPARWLLVVLLLAACSSLSAAWQTPLPIPTVDRADLRWKSNAFWRGDVSPPTNYQIASGLAAYGHKELAADFADKTIVTQSRTASANTGMRFPANRWASGNTA